MTIGPNSPVLYADDIGNMTWVGSSTDKTWTDTTNHGQSFTTGSEGGYLLKSFSMQVNTTSQVTPPPANKTWNIRLVTISGTNTVTKVLETGHISSGTWQSGDWFTWTLDTPYSLEANTLYGVDVEMTSGGAYQPGIPYFRYNTTSSVADSYRYTRADIEFVEGIPTGNPTTISANIGHDRVFHIDLQHPLAPSPGNGSEVPAGDLILSWTNLEPNTGTDVWVDVWFGTDPGNLSKLTATPQLNLTSFLVNLPGADTYYWRIDSYLDGDPPVTPVQSPVFSFFVFDSDGDGFPDDYEELHTDPPSATALNREDDRDTDGINNWDEFQAGTNPSLIDTDGDGLLDGADIILTSADSRYAAWATAGILYTDSGAQRTFRGESPLGTDPLIQDTDGDGLLDGAESAIGTNPTLADTDADGLEDGVETNTGTYVSTTDTGTDPLDPDSDSDGAGDWYEVVIIDKNPALGSPPNSPNDAGLKPNMPYPLSDPDPEDTGVTDKPVKVYIMSGQSNMVGFGTINGNGPGTLKTMTGQENKFPNLVDSDGLWTTRKDVKYRGVISDTGNGALKPDVSGNTYGPEIGFGYIMGEYHEEPVLLIKASQGNRGLMWDLLPPGSPRTPWTNDTTYPAYGESPETFSVLTGPTPFQWYAGKQYDDFFLKENDMGPLMTWMDGTTYPDGTQIWHNGVHYISKNLPNVANHTASPSTEPGVDGTDWATYWEVYSVFNTADILDDFANQYDTWASQGFEIAGFVWWQGYDDQGEPRATRYEPNMVQFIKQVRSYYENRYPGKVVPNAPFVLATLATNGGWGNTDAGSAKVAQAQLNVDGDAGIYTEFDGNVKTVEARGFWRAASESPGNVGYHYNLNAETYLLVGDALGRAMVELQGNITPPGNTFTDWIAGKPGVGGQTGVNDDPDGDGIDSGVENFFGTAPGVFSRGLVAGTSSGNTFTFTHPQGTLADDLSAAYRWSTDLASFHGDGEASAGTTVSFTTQANTPETGMTTVTATVGGTPVARLFVRVEVTSN